MRKFLRALEYATGKNISIARDRRPYKLTNEWNPEEKVWIIYVENLSDFAYPNVFQDRK